MKCPFRKVKDYLNVYNYVTHTTHKKAERISIDFEDCYEQECMAFINKGACGLIVNKKESMNYEK